MNNNSLNLPLGSFISSIFFSKSHFFVRMEAGDTLPRHEYENVRIDSDGGETTARDMPRRHEYENVRVDSDGEAKG